MSDMDATCEDVTIMEMPATVPARELHKLGTAELIAQYDKAISSYSGRNTNCSPRQKRINLIVDMLSDRADAGDPVSLAWFKEDQ